MVFGVLELQGFKGRVIENEGCRDEAFDVVLGVWAGCL